MTALEDTALELVETAGNYATAQRALNPQVHRKGDGIDIVTEVDIACENRMIETIRKTFAEHGIVGEETGQHGPQDAPFQWYLDPLDGTHNYAMGLSTYGVCATVCYEGQPVVSAVRDSVQRRTTHARLHHGVFVDGTATVALPETAPQSATVSWMQGYRVTKNDPFAAQAHAALRLSAKRVLQTWAPAIDWGLLAAGHVSAIVAYHNELHDAIGGYLIATELGGVVHHMRDDSVVVVGEQSTVQRLAAILDQLPAATS